MESFWIAETLKYLYLIFEEPPDRCLHPSCAGKATQQARIPLTKFVFNTEAHPLPIVGPVDSSIIGIETEFDRKLLYPFTLNPEEDTQIDDQAELAPNDGFSEEEIEEHPEETEDSHSSTVEVQIPGADSHDEL